MCGKKFLFRFPCTSSATSKFDHWEISFCQSCFGFSQYSYLAIECSLLRRHKCARREPLRPSNFTITPYKGFIIKGNILFSFFTCVRIPTTWRGIVISRGFENTIRYWPTHPNPSRGWEGEMNPSLHSKC